MAKKKTENTTLEEQLNEEQTVEEQAVEQQAVEQQPSSVENDGASIAEEPHEIIERPESEVTAETEPIAAEESPAEEVEPEAEEAAKPNLEEQLEQAKQEAAHYLDNWQRSVAELANFKRRQDEQSKLQRDRIKSEVLEGVISALDDLDLAFQNLPEEIDGQLIGWVEGFRLVQRKLHKILDDQNVMPISTEGKFDPNYHEAISYEPNEDHETDDIIAELRKGYQIGSRVIRPALVRVAS